MTGGAVALHRDQMTKLVVEREKELKRRIEETRHSAQVKEAERLAREVATRRRDHEVDDEDEEMAVLDDEGLASGGVEEDSEDLGDEAR